MPLYLIVGPAGSGKSTVGRMLGTRLGLRCADTSAALVEEGRRRAAAGEAVPWDPERDRPTREWLVRRGNERTDADPACLVRECVEAGARIVCGVRRLRELIAVRREFPGAVVAWVGGREGADAHADNLEVCRGDATAVVRNDGTLAQLEESVRCLVWMTSGPQYAEAQGC